MQDEWGDESDVNINNKRIMLLRVRNLNSNRAIPGYNAGIFISIVASIPDIHNKHNGTHP